MEFYKISSYRQFVRTYLDRRGKAGRPKISRLAEAIRVHSTFVSQVLSGKKDFNLEQGIAVSEFLDLTTAERKYFLLLIQKERAGTRALKTYFENEIALHRESLLKVSNRISKHAELSEQDKAIFYSHWSYLAVWLATSLEDGKDAERINHLLRIGRKKTAQILEFLIETKLCLHQNGRFVMGPKHLHVSNESPFVFNHHANWRSRAIERIPRMQPTELAFTSPVSLSRSDMTKVKERLLVTIQEVVDLAKQSPAEELVFLNIDWLKVADRTDFDD